MDKDITEGKHIVNMATRSNITISGVKKIENFDESEFLVVTNKGLLNIKGENLEIIKLDTFQGDLSIKGKINSLGYEDSLKKSNKGESLISKLFK